jgi:hypothetical protein
MATPLINGINYSWANVSLVLFGVPVVGITKIDYKRKQKKENNYGFGSQPVSRGYGAYEYEGSIELYLDEWKRIIAAAPNRDPLLIPPFDIQVVYTGRGVVPDRDVLKSCEFMEDNMTANQGDTKLLVTVPLIIGLINR